MVNVVKVVKTPVIQGVVSIVTSGMVPHKAVAMHRPVLTSTRSPTNMKKRKMAEAEPVIPKPGR